MPQPPQLGYEILEDEPDIGLGYEILEDDENVISQENYDFVDENDNVIDRKTMEETPEFVAGLMADPNFNPTQKQFNLYKEHNSDTPWAEVLNNTVDYFGSLIANGVEDLSDLAEETQGIAAAPALVGTVAEGFVQGNSGLYQVIAQSQDPKSWAFKTKKAIIEAWDGTHEGSVAKKVLSKGGAMLAGPALMLDAVNYFKGKKLTPAEKKAKRDKAEYMQFMLAREWAKHALELEGGDTNLIGEALASYGAISNEKIKDLPIKGRAAAMLGMGFDASTFVGGAIVTAPGKAVGKAAGKALTKSGRWAKGVGQTAGEAINNFYSNAAETIAKAAPDVDRATTEAAVAAATGTSKIRALGQLAGMPGEVVEAYGKTMERGASRVPVLTQIQEDMALTGATRRAAFLAEQVPVVPGLIKEGVKQVSAAGSGAAVGAGLGYWSEGTEGAVGGGALGSALGAAGGVLGRTISKVSGATKSANVKGDWARFTESMDPETAARNEFYAGDTQVGKEKVMDLTTLAKGVTAQDVDVIFKTGEEWKDQFYDVKRSGPFMQDVTKIVQEGAGAHLIEGEKPAVYINLDYEGPNSLAHEIVHAMSNLDGVQDQLSTLQNMLIGQAAGTSGARVTKGLLNDAQIKQAKKDYRDKLSDPNKDRFDKMDDASQERAMVEEIAADYFASFINKGKSDLLLNTKKTWDVSSREFWRGQLDKALLNHADSVFGKMRNSMLRGFGQMFEPVTGKVESDYVGKNGEPVTMSAEVNAALREMIRGKKIIREKMDLHNDPNRFVLNPRSMTQNEMNQLGSHLSRTGMFDVDDKGRHFLKDDETLMGEEIAAAENIVEALEQAGDTTDPSVVQRIIEDDGNVTFSGGKFSEAQVKFIENHPDIDPKLKKQVKEINDNMGNGNQILIDYYAATKNRYRKNKKTGRRYRMRVYSSGIKGRSRFMVPYSWEISKAGNLFVRSLDVSQMEAKLGKMKNHLEPWQGNRNAFWQDVLTYTRNLDRENPIPSKELFGKEKRNILNQFFNARGREATNPLALGKTIKDKDFLIRSFRADRIAKWDPRPDRDFIPFNEDIYALNQQNFMPKGDVSTWHRDAVGDVEENLRLAQARKPKTGVAKNPAIRFEDAQGKPIYIGATEKDGGKPFAGWAEETKIWLSPEEISAARQWYRVLNTEFERVFGKQKAGRMMMSWLGAQQNASPIAALANVFRVQDRLAGIVELDPKTGKVLKGGLADEKIQQILTGKLPKKGFGPKLSDFVDSAYLRETRTFMGGDKAGGKPFVADVHTGRDSGHVDHTTLSRLIQKSKDGLFIDGQPVKITPLETKKIKAKDRTQEVPVRVGIERADGSKQELTSDMIGSPGSTQYEGISVWGNKLSDWLNENNFEGGNWSPLEAQAAGWMRILRQYGLPESTVAEAMVTNTHRISAEVNYDYSQGLSKEYPVFNELPLDVQQKITRDVLTNATKDIAKIVGGSLKVQSIKTGVGFWQGTKSPSVQIFTLGSPAAAGIFRDSLALVSQQGGTLSVQFGKGGKDKRAVKFKRTNGQALTQKQIDSLMESIKGDKKAMRLMSGFSAHATPDDKGLLIAGLSGKGETYVEKILTDWAARHRIDLDVDGLSAVTETTSNDWSVQRNGEGYLPKIIERGGSERARLVDDYRKTYVQHLENAFQEHAPGLLDPTKAQERILGSVDPLPKNLQKAQGVIRNHSGSEDVNYLPVDGNSKTRRVQQIYARKSGIEYKPHGGYFPVNPDLLSQVADWFQQQPHEPDSPVVQASYKALRDETLAQFDALKKAGLKFEAWKGDGEPYANSKEMMKDVRDNNHMWYFSTDKGFGEDSIPGDHPMLEEIGNGMVLNDAFRIVHDYFGHTPQGFQFGQRGEYNAYLEHSSMYSQLAQGALAAETLAQNAWVNFGSHLRGLDGRVPLEGESGYVHPRNRPFAQQKATVVPSEILNAAAADTTFKPRGKIGDSEFLENQIGWRIVKAGTKYRVYSPDGSMAGVGKSIESAEKIANKKIGK